MKVFSSALILLIVSSLPAFSRGKLQGYCEKGGVTVTVGGSSGTPKVQGSYPSCTVAVYDAGTLALADIYEDNSGTAKANPFTASSTGQWFFYADNGRYDVRLSGTVNPAFTIGDLMLSDPLAPGMDIDWITNVSNKPYFVDLREYGAACDDATNVQPAITAAIAAGKSKFFLPAHCRWIPTGNVGNASIEIYGEDPVTSRIDSATPANDFLLMGANSKWRNFGTKNRFCKDNASPAGTDKVCSVGYAENVSPNSMILEAWNNVAFWSSHDGDGADNDRPIIQLILGPGNGGDGVYAGVSDIGVGFRAHQYGTGKGFLAIQMPTATAGYAVNIDQESTAGYGLYVHRKASGEGALFEDDAVAGNTMKFITLKTGGNLIDVFQNSVYAGTFLYINANTFTGNFVDFTIANTSKFKVDYTGTATSGAGFLISEGTAAGNDFSVSTSSKTGGAMFSAYHGTSTYGGTVLQANMANSGGTFSGLFVDLKVAGTSKFSVAATGIPIIGALKSTTGTVFICADTSGALVRSASACSGTI